MADLRRLVRDNPDGEPVLGDFNDRGRENANRERLHWWLARIRCGAMDAFECFHKITVKLTSLLTTLLKQFGELALQKQPIASLWLG